MTQNVKLSGYVYCRRCGVNSTGHGSGLCKACRTIQCKCGTVVMLQNIKKGMTPMCTPCRKETPERREWKLLRGLR